MRAVERPPSTVVAAVERLAVVLMGRNPSERALRFGCQTIAAGCKVGAPARKVAARSARHHPPMPCLIVCECGRCLQADSPDELVAAMQRHLEAAHPQIAGAALPGDLLAMIDYDG